MSSPKPSYPPRASFLCYGYILAFALVLMAFEHRTVSKELIKEEWSGKPLVPIMERHTPVKPEPGERAPADDDDPVGPSLEPKKKPKKPSNEAKLKKKDLKMGSVNTEEKKPRMKIPEPKGKEPVPAYELDRYALLPGCESEKEKEAQLACTKKKLVDFLRARTHYPKILKEQGVEGKVLVLFVVDQEGKLGDVRILRSSHPLLSQAVKDAVEELPSFIPAMQGGQKVKTWQRAPVRFNLRE